MGTNGPCRSEHRKRCKARDLDTRPRAKTRPTCRAERKNLNFPTERGKIRLIMCSSKTAPAANGGFLFISRRTYFPLRKPNPKVVLIKQNAASDLQKWNTSTAYKFSDRRHSKIQNFCGLLNRQNQPCRRRFSSSHFHPLKSYPKISTATPMFLFYQSVYLPSQEENYSPRIRLSLSWKRLRASSFFSSGFVGSRRILIRSSLASKM